jgi:endo-1,4-beta-xylanase
MANLPENLARLNKRQFIRALGNAAAAGAVATSPMLAYAQKKRPLVDDVPAQYGGSEDSAAWRTQAANNIEALRKGNFGIQVLDASGKPTPGAELHAKLYRHDFGFGAALRLPRLFDKKYSNELRAQYLEICQQQFHKFTPVNAFKWKHFEKHEPYIESFLGWSESISVPVRGHCLYWPSFRRVPKDIQKYRGNEKKFAKVLLAHGKRMAKKYGGPVTEWDVLNEPFKDNEFMEILGKDVVIDWFKAVEKSNPKVVRYINDYGILTKNTKRHRDFYFDYIQWLLSENAPVQGIGFQSHIPQGVKPTAPVKILSIMDRFQTLGLPLQVTEFDFEHEDEDFQARYTHDFLTAVFSHPGMVGLVNWTPYEFALNSVSKPAAALYDRNLRRKPNGDVWHELVNKAWSTDTKLVADKEGMVYFRGFKGLYHINAAAGSVSSRFELQLKDPNVLAEINFS